MVKKKEKGDFEILMCLFGYLSVPFFEPSMQKSVKYEHKGNAYYDNWLFIHIHLNNTAFSQQKTWLCFS